MADYSVKLLAKKPVTHNVNAYTVEKPAGFTYTPGQATDFSIQKDPWTTEKRPFTFTSLPTADTLEFTIKSYTDHDGVTNALTKVQPGDHFEIGDAWGAIEYKGEGVFLAGGAGITPFLAIFRDLYSKGEVAANQLFFSNRTTADIILKEELENILGDHFFNLISDENAEGYYHGRIDKAFLQQHVTHFDQPFYVCGPDAFTESILKALEELGAKAETLVFEK